MAGLDGRHTTCINSLMRVSQSTTDRRRKSSLKMKDQPRMPVMRKGDLRAEMATFITARACSTTVGVILMRPVPQKVPSKRWA